MGKTLRLDLKSSPETVAILHEHIEKFAQENNLSSKVQASMQMSLGEIVLNIIVHGYKRLPDKDILVEMEVRPAEIRMTVVDSAPPFNPWKKSEGDGDGEPLMDFDSGGLGTYLVSQLMDKVSHEYVDGKNRVVMIKSLAAAE